jgi:hypothetical protein
MKRMETFGRRLLQGVTSILAFSAASSLSLSPEPLFLYYSKEVSQAKSLHPPSRFNFSTMQARLSAISYKRNNSNFIT